MKTIYILRAYEDVASYVTMLEDEELYLSCDAAAYSLKREDLPFGGFISQGYAIEEVAERRVAADSNEYLAAYYGRHDAPALEVSNA